MATSPTLRSKPGSREFDLRRLAPLVLSRGLDQLALGLTSLLLARRTGTEAFAPFATLYILYALSGQVADGGLAFAVLRTPVDGRVSSRSRVERIGANLAIALTATFIGTAVGGPTGTVIVSGGWVWFTGSLAYVGRATLQWANLDRRLARTEAGSAMLFFALVVFFVRGPDDLPVFGLLLAGKSLVEFLAQGLPSQVFAQAGRPPSAGAEWLGQIITYAAANVDYLLVGTILGPAALSVYAVAFRLASAFSSVVASPLTRSAFVQYANAENLQQVNARIVRQIALVGSAGLALTVLTAPLLPLVLGDGWEDTSRLTILLGLALPWRLLLGPTVALGISTGRARSVVLWEGCRLVVLVAAIMVFPFSVFTVAGAVAVATIASITWAHSRAARESDLDRAPWLLVVSGSTIALITTVAALS